MRDIERVQSLNEAGGQPPRNAMRHLRRHLEIDSYNIQPQSCNHIVYIVLKHISARNGDLWMVCSDGLTEVNIVPLKKEAEDDRVIVTSLMRASQLTLAPLIEKEADIYTVEDLKVRFR